MMDWVKDRQEMVHRIEQVAETIEGLGRTLGRLGAVEVSDEVDESLAWLARCFDYALYDVRVDLGKWKNLLAGAKRDAKKARL